MLLFKLLILLLSNFIPVLYYALLIGYNLTHEGSIEVLCLNCVHLSFFEILQSFPEHFMVPRVQIYI
jgi:hypothetical protein